MKRFSIAALVFASAIALTIPKISFASAWCCRLDGGGALQTYASLALCNSSNPPCSPSGTTGLTGTCKEAATAAVACAVDTNPILTCCKNGAAITESRTCEGACDSCVPQGQSCPTAAPPPPPGAPTLPAAPITATVSGRVTLPNPLGTTSPEELIGRLIKAVLSIVGSLALLMFIYGGVLWMTAQGNGDDVKKGKNVIVWSVAGLVVIFSAYVVLKYVLSALQGTFTP